MGITAAARWSGVLAAVLLVTSACSPGVPASSTSPTHAVLQSVSAAAKGQDPPPSLPVDGHLVGASGGKVSQDGVSVSVPAGAVRPGEQADIKIGANIGKVSGAFTTELAGRPVSVEHRGALSSALTLSWQVPELTARQRASVVLARWDPALKVWQSSTVKVRWSGATLSADIKTFSSWTWWANFGQQVGQLTGSRVGEPSCTSAKLPAWVTATVDPDQDVDAAAIRACFETDKDQRVTVRVANNRTFTQQMQMTRGGQQWAWTWKGDDAFSVPAVVYSAAHTVSDSGTRFMLPPLSTQAVGVARPAGPGSHHIEAASTVNATTVLVDVAAYAISQQPIGGTDNPALNALVQVMYECGGKELLARPNLTKPDALLRATVSAAGSCADEILRPDSEFGARFENLSRTMIAKSKLTAGAAVQANRAVRQISGAFTILKYGEVAFYLSDQLANAVVGPLSWSITGRGHQPSLGNWSPSCSSYAKDSDSLYSNVALQDQFSNTSKELWEFKGLPDAAHKGVTPLLRCATSYRAGLGAFLPTSWADPKAARIVATELLDGIPDTTAKRASGAPLTPFVGRWAQHAGVLVIRSDGSGSLTWQDTSHSLAPPDFPVLALRVTANSAMTATAVITASDTSRYYPAGVTINLTRTTIGLAVSGNAGPGKWCDGRHFASGDCGA